MADVTITRVTAEEFLQLPVSSKVIELINGEVIAAPSPVDKHLRENGIREYWIVDAEELYIEVYVLQDGEYKRRGVFGLGETFSSAVLSGVTLTVDALLKG